jgi:hypothetical protein
MFQHRTLNRMSTLLFVCMMERNEALCRESAVWLEFVRRFVSARDSNYVGFFSSSFTSSLIKHGIHTKWHSFNTESNICSRNNAYLSVAAGAGHMHNFGSFMDVIWLVVVMQLIVNVTSYHMNLTDDSACFLM